MGFFDRSKKTTKPPTDNTGAKLYPKPPPPPPPPSRSATAPPASTAYPPSGFQPAGYPPGPSEWTPPFGYQPGYGARQNQSQPMAVNQYCLPQPAHQAVSSTHASSIVGTQSAYSLQASRRPSQPQPHSHAGAHAAHYQPQAHRPAQSSASASASGSTSSNTNTLINSTLHDLRDLNLTEDWHPHATQLLNQTVACADTLATSFNSLMTSIDSDKYQGHEGDLFALPSAAPPLPPRRDDTGHHHHHHVHHASSSPPLPPPLPPPPPPDRPPKPKRRYDSSSTTQKTHNSADDEPPQNPAATKGSSSYFSKVHLYANSRLPSTLPPLRLYMPTWPLLCLAAQYAESVYKQPSSSSPSTPSTPSTSTHIVPPDRRSGTKAMVIKSIPMDHASAIVFAIRGSATFSDWAVNLNSAPASPAGFLDDPGNLCHAGFLGVARAMAGPVAERLRRLLDEDPSRESHSLVVTGHSAGGAVAALLYCHMLAVTEAARGELSDMAGRFKRVHCVVFGTPPVSLLPLGTPGRGEDEEERDRARRRDEIGPRLGQKRGKSLFLSFLNEGDPVARADRGYVKSLLELLASPAPASAAAAFRNARTRRGRSSASRSRERERSRGGTRDGQRRRTTTRRKSRDVERSRGRDEEREFRQPRSRSRKNSELLAPRPSRDDMEDGGVKRKKSVVRFAGISNSEEDEDDGRIKNDTDTDTDTDTDNNYKYHYKPTEPRQYRERISRPTPRRKDPVWKVPDCPLSSPGRIIVLRSGNANADADATTAGNRKRTVEDRLNEGVVAQTVTDEQLRGVVWGDPVCHVMRLYAGRIETLAVGAVTGKGGTMW